jgi:tellurite methyltransferase
MHPPLRAGAPPQLFRRQKEVLHGPTLASRGLRHDALVVTENPAFKPTEENWRRFVEATSGQPPWPRLVAASHLLDRPGDALDVGAGAGRDSRYLLEHGWRVTAVDASEHSVAALQRLATVGDLRVVRSAAQDFTPGKYDLVNAQYSLPFIPPTLFPATVKRLQDAVRPSGVMAATFFGPHDEWNTLGTDITFLTRAEVETLFDGWDVKELDEVDEDGTTATGGSKHWHTFNLIARRRPA